jgi:threonine dehydrogenase-like Zn-dependent dehydrogenase
MSDKLAKYRAVDYKLPASYLSWDLFGKGLENLGRNHQAVELPLRAPNSDELLLRVDALGLCFSDTKLIWAGNEHARIQGRDLEKDPTVAGHEAALTVVKVGKNWKNKFNVGERYIIQADIFIDGEQKAFGYVQRGAMAQYAYVGPWVLDGDDGCYLLPLKNSTGYAEAALVEPWACVEAAYNIPHRSSPKPGGRLLVVFAENLPAYFDGMYPHNITPSFAAVLGETDQNLTEILGASGLVKRIPPTPADVAAAMAEGTKGAGFDDIVLVGKTSPEMVSACDKALAQDGILAFMTYQNSSAEFDIGRVHYHRTRHVGTSSGVIMNAYAANKRRELKSHGNAWMIGAAGPMGQMHVQRSLEIENPPKNVFATDLSAERLEFMKKRLQVLADRKGVNLVCRDVTDPTGLDKEIRKLTNSKGFDDLYVHAPVAALVEQAARNTATDSVLNIFAGVVLGTMAKISPDIFVENHVRMIGSSGSSMDDIKGVLRKMEAGKLATRMSLAGLGGIEATWDGIKGLRENRFPGKTVIFPHIRNLDLMAPQELDKVCPEAVSKLEPGNVWTNRAEEALLGKLLEI